MNYVNVRRECLLPPNNAEVEVLCFLSKVRLNSNGKILVNLCNNVSTLKKIYISVENWQRLSSASDKVKCWKPNVHKIAGTFCGHRFYLDESLADAEWSFDFSVRSNIESPAEFPGSPLMNFGMGGLSNYTD